MDAKNISFSYSPEGKDIIQDVSMHIKEGEKIAIVGYNGAGKTTLVKLLMRLYDVNSGRISVNGHDIKDYSVDNYRSAIGTVFQDFKLFAGSIYENVLMDNKSNEAQMQRKKVIAALEKSGLYEKVMELPDKEETMITTEIYENGVNLSGGESQKLAISRIFFRDVGLFIMDEPSSALDPIAEYQLNQTLLKETLGKAVIFISHRLSTTRFADRIIMMENGKIVEEGNHRELIELNGKYARMWNAQAGPYIM
jgi:ATP-binding cassette subfamily B protein